MAIADQNTNNLVLSSILEVWLFDKSDIRTVTAHLLPPEIYEDEDQRLSYVGESGLVYPLEPETEIHMQTEMLEAFGRIGRVTFGPSIGGDPTIESAQLLLAGQPRRPG